VTVIKDAKVISEDSGIGIGREVGVKLADDDKVIIIQIGGEGAERSGAIVILGVGIDVTSVGKILVEIGVEVESGKVENLHA
jgi:hypothetical protein